MRYGAGPRSQTDRPTSDYDQSPESSTERGMECDLPAQTEQTADHGARPVQNSGLREYLASHVGVGPGRSVVPLGKGACLTTGDVLRRVSAPREGTSRHMTD